MYVKYVEYVDVEVYCVFVVKYVIVVKLILKFSSGVSTEIKKAYLLDLRCPLRY